MQVTIYRFLKALTISSILNVELYSYLTYFYSILDKLFKVQVSQYKLQEVPRLKKVRFAICNFFFFSFIVYRFLSHILIVVPLPLLFPVPLHLLSHLNSFPFSPILENEQILKDNSKVKYNRIQYKIKQKLTHWSRTKQTEGKKVHEKAYQIEPLICKLRNPKTLQAIIYMQKTCRLKRRNIYIKNNKIIFKK